VPVRSAWGAGVRPRRRLSRVSGARSPPARTPEGVGLQQALRRFTSGRLQQFHSGSGCGEAPFAPRCRRGRHGGTCGGTQPQRARVRLLCRKGTQAAREPLTAPLVSALQPFLVLDDAAAVEEIRQLEAQPTPGAV
jgi:hypothetical protein